ncbi:MAG: SAV_2336 N-terminal domain-related protein, partial [Cyanobacteria bacterium J06628_3]
SPSINTQGFHKPASAKISSQTEQKLPTSSKNNTLPLRVPDAPSLREPLTLAQVLKPLMRRVESGRKTVLDETATVERTAAEGICIPILKSEAEPWLDVALVVDESKSMLIWRHTIWELKRLLENYGVFRDVRAWGLVTDENGQIYIRPGIGKNARQQRQTSHREILDPNRRRLILLVSDCIAAIWRNGAITQILKDWTNTQPVALIQMLPDWLWLKTGLGLGASVTLGSLTPGVANKHLLVKKQLLWKDINLNTGIKIPVLTLEPDTALPWSQMLAGKSDALASGFVLSSASSQTKTNSSRQQPQTTTPQKVNASERVYRFRMTASPMGRKLAGLLAAAPVINLPVVRLIQETLLPPSRQVHVAEV